MELVPGFVQLMQPLASTMATPTFDSLITVLTGWVFARRRTVTQMILAAGSSADKHYSSYHRVFSAASWSLDGLGLALFDLIQPFLGEVVMIGLDDTLARKRGRKMFGTTHCFRVAVRQSPTGAIAGWSWACSSSCRFAQGITSVCRFFFACT